MTWESEVHVTEEMMKIVTGGAKMSDLASANILIEWTDMLKCHHVSRASAFLNVLNYPPKLATAKFKNVFQNIVLEQEQDGLKASPVQVLCLWQMNCTCKEKSLTYVLDISLYWTLI